MDHHSKDKKNLNFSWLLCCTEGGIPAAVVSSKSTPSNSGQSPENEVEKQVRVPPKSEVVKTREKPGWKAMPFVIGNETFERLASIGLQVNFMMFMMTQFHKDQVSASNVLNVWNAVMNFLPLVGAFIADAYLGRFLTISFSTIASLTGLVTLTLIAWLPSLHPPPCDFLQNPKSCKPAKSSQMGVLYLALGLLSIGAAGIRPCSIPFGVDQFDQTTEKGRKGMNSYFNWYYTTFTFVLIFAVTVMVYIQDNLSWVYGFGVPCMLMFCAVVFFFVGTRLYVYVKPEGSVFMDIAQGLVAAYKKRKLKLPNLDGNGEIDQGMFYDPPVIGVRKLPFTNQFRFLNKAAIILEGEVKQDGTREAKWSLSSIQRIEEIKCLIRIIPIWASGIICFTALTQQFTFSVSSANKMDRHLGPKFQIPPGTLPVISFITIGIFLPIYDRLIVPILRKRTKIEGGITLLQRIGVGFVFSIASMIVAGLVEKKRRNSALAHPNPDGIAPITVFWLAPQFILMGLCEAFNLLGQIEFYNKEFPDSMISLANSLFSVTMAGANYISLIIVNVVHNTTGRNGHPDWLSQNINAGRLEYFYYVIAGLGLLNFAYYLAIAPRYKYKSRVRIDEDEHEESQFDIELNGIIKHRV